MYKFTNFFERLLVEFCVIHYKDISLSSSSASSRAPFTYAVLGVWSCLLLPLIFLLEGLLWWSDAFSVECCLGSSALAVNMEYVARVSCSSCAVLVRPAAIELLTLLRLLLDTAYCSAGSSHSKLILCAEALLMPVVEASLSLRCMWAFTLSMLVRLRPLPLLKEEYKFELHISTPEWLQLSNIINFKLRYIKDIVGSYTGCDWNKGKVTGFPNSKSSSKTDHKIKHIRSKPKVNNHQAE